MYPLLSTKPPGSGFNFTPSGNPALPELARGSWHLLCGSTYVQSVATSFSASPLLNHELLEGRDPCLSF